MPAASLFSGVFGRSWFAMGEPRVWISKSNQEQVKEAVQFSMK
jgi:hypothetical protein